MVHNVAGYKITDKYRNLKIFIVKISFSYIIMRKVSEIFVARLKENMQFCTDNCGKVYKTYTNLHLLV